MNELSSKSVITHCIFNLGCGGAERNLVTTVQQLHARGFHNQHIVISDFSSPADLHYEKDLAPLATIHRADDVSGGVRGNAPRLLRMLPQRLQYNIIKIQNCLNAIQPDVVHVWSDNAYAVVAASLLPVRCIVLTWQSMPPVFWHKMGVRSWRQWPKTMLDCLLFRMALRNPAVRTACVCRAGGTGYARWLGLAPEAVVTLYHGMDTTLWQRASEADILAEKQRLSIPPQNKVILGLMRFDPAKRPELWLDVAAHARKKYGDDLSFLCFGDGPLRAGMMERARQVGVICPGVTRNVPLALSMADIFLHTARIEGLPTVHLEAQLMGTPIVTTDAGGTGETVREAITARLVPEQPDMVSALSDTLIAALHDKDFLAQASQEGPHFVKENFSIEQMIQTTLELYR